MYIFRDLLFHNNPVIIVFYKYNIALETDSFKAYYTHTILGKTSVDDILITALSNIAAIAAVTSKEDCDSEDYVLDSLCKSMRNGQKRTPSLWIQT